MAKKLNSLSMGNPVKVLDWDAVYESYRELELLLYELRREGLIKSRVYRQTIPRLAKPDELAYAIDFFEDLLGWDRALKPLRDARGLRH